MSALKPFGRRPRTTCAPGQKFSEAVPSSPGGPGSGRTLDGPVGPPVRRESRAPPCSAPCGAGVPAPVQEGPGGSTEAAEAPALLRQVLVSARHLGWRVHSGSEATAQTRLQMQRCLVRPLPRGTAHVERVYVAHGDGGRHQGHCPHRGRARRAAPPGCGARRPRCRAHRSQPHPPTGSPARTPATRRKRFAHDTTLMLSLEAGSFGVAFCNWLLIINNSL